MDSIERKFDNQPEATILSGVFAGEGQLIRSVARGRQPMRRRKPEEIPMSGLRRARKHRNMTLADLVREIDARDPDSGVTESMASAWELGKQRTSPRYRRICCEIYRLPTEVLFAYQDDPDERARLGLVDAEVVDPHAGLGAPAGIVVGAGALFGAMLEVIQGAQEYLVVTGSRSRNPAYLEAIEQALGDRSRLVHYRVLFGAPHHQVLKEHLVRLLELRDPKNREYGMKTLHIGMLTDLADEPERFFVASEWRAVVTVPSMVTAGNFDTGVVLGHPRQARGLVEHAKQLYPAAQRLETAQAVNALPVLP